MYLLELVDKIEGIKKAYEAVKDAEVFEGMPTLDELIEEAIDAVSDHESVTRKTNVYRIREAIVQSIAKMMDEEEDIKEIYRESTANQIFESMDEFIEYLKDDLSNEDLYYVLHNNDLEGHEIYAYDGVGAVETFYECEALIETINEDGFIRWLNHYTMNSNVQLFEQFLNSFDWIADYSKGLTEIWNRCPITARTYQEEKKEDDGIEATLLLDDEPIMINHETGEVIKND